MLGVSFRDQDLLVVEEPRTVLVLLSQAPQIVIAISKALQPYA
jgi:hypothetical protein